MQNHSNRCAEPKVAPVCLHVRCKWSVAAALALTATPVYLKNLVRDLSKLESHLVDSLCDTLATFVIATCFLASPYVDWPPTYSAPEHRQPFPHTRTVCTTFYLVYLLVTHVIVVNQRAVPPSCVNAAATTAVPRGQRNLTQASTKR